MKKVLEAIPSLLLKKAPEAVLEPEDISFYGCFQNDTDRPITFIPLFSTARNSINTNISNRFSLLPGDKSPLVSFYGFAEETFEDFKLVQIDTDFYKDHDHVDHYKYYADANFVEFVETIKVQRDPHPIDITDLLPEFKVLPSDSAYDGNLETVIKNTRTMSIISYNYWY